VGASVFAAATDIDLALHHPRMCPPTSWVGCWPGTSWVGGEGDLADELVTLLLRSAGSHDAAAEQLRTVFGRQVAGCVRQVTHETPDWERRAGLIATQVLGVSLCRYVLRLPPVVSMSAEELAAAIGETLQRYLFGDLDVHDPGSHSSRACDAGR
jgi:Tetracyclin repressor-like, C-terminal domain